MQLLREIIHRIISCIVPNFLVLEITGVQQPKISSVWRMAVCLALPSYYKETKEPQPITGRLSTVQADTSGVDWSDKNLEKIEYFNQSPINDVILVLFRN